ncbi:MAG: heme-binding protein [Bradyrhizobiaceae bacterium]|nr:heme-binding protein [Bradyrhizobiaceae bacterium]
MLKKAGLAAGAVALAFAPCPGNAQTAYVQTQRDITWKLGLAIAQGAIAECAKTNVGISVAVVDRAGRVRVFIASDDPSPHNFELARRKAYTARTFRRPTLEWAQRTKEGSDLAPQRQLADVIALGGGVPINVGNDTIGAVGVSGSSQTGDDACARAGIEKVADQLNAN